MNARRTYADFKVFSRSYLRNKVALFFTLFFPVLLILLFGEIVTSSNTTVDLTVQNLDGNTNVSAQFLAALNHTGVLSLSFVPPSAGNLSKYMAAHDLTAGLVIPAGFSQAYLQKKVVSLVLYTDPGSPSTTGVVQGAVGGVVNYFNLNASGAHPIVQVTGEDVGSQVYTYLDYLTPGLIGFSILTSPMFSMVNIIAEYKKERIFKQISLTPLTKAEWLTSKILWYFILTFIAAFIIMGVSYGVFNSHVTLTLLALPFLFVGPLLFVALGMIAGAVAKTPESAAVIGNLITFPMMFLAGTFFPVQSFNPSLQAVAHVLPLYYVIDGMNNAMILDNTGQALFDLAVTSVIAVIFFIIAILVFPWREE